MLNATFSSSALESRKLSNFESQGMSPERSPFGLQAFMREELQILKAENIGKLAFALALRGSRQQIQDPAYAESIIANRPDWVAEFQIVRLIEKSLWINGQSDLVMTMTRNPSQIPDNPPPSILESLSKAYTHHPEAAVWYGVPLFSEETNAQGLPIPLTAKEVRAEHQERIQIAQNHALRWRWYYRTLARFPTLMRQTKQLVMQSAVAVVEYFKRARRDSKRREIAAHCAHMEYCRTGRSWTRIPEHTTALGEVTAIGLETIDLSKRFLKLPVALTGGVAIPVGTAHLIVTISPALMIVPMDPFLFVELPDEPGKLRFVGHWFWQKKEHGKEVLHLHV